MRDLKKIVYVLIIVLSISTLVACSSDRGDETNTTNTYDWPVKTIEVVVPANAGGDTDFNARTMAKYFEEITGVKMVITNMAGAGGSIATSHVKEAKPDGEIMLFSHTGQLIVNEVSGLADYGYKDFDLICIPAVDRASVFVINNELGIDSVEELVNFSKESEIVYGSEFGSTTQLQALVLEDKTGVNLKIVDAGNASERVTELLGGRIDMTSIPYGIIQDHIETGDLVALAQLSGTHNDLIEDVKTVKEQDYEYDMDKPYIAAYPEGTDSNLIDETAKVMKEITGNEDYKLELETSYRQPVSYYGKEDALVLLEEVLEDYRDYEELLRD